KPTPGQKPPVPQCCSHAPTSCSRSPCSTAWWVTRTSDAQPTAHLMQEGGFRAFRSALTRPERQEPPVREITPAALFYIPNSLFSFCRRVLTLPFAEANKFKNAGG